MDIITLRYLVAMLQAAPRGTRDHASNLNTLKFAFERESASLQLLFGTIGAAGLALFSSLLATLLRTLDEPGGWSSENNLSDDQWLLGVAFVVVLVSVLALMALVYRRLQVTKDMFGEITEFYYLLDRLTP